VAEEVSTDGERFRTASRRRGQRRRAPHHGPPEANRSSRIDKQTLGILLFIITEVMVFGAFFASYFSSASSSTR